MSSMLVSLFTVTPAPSATVTVPASFCTSAITVPTGNATELLGGTVSVMLARWRA